MYLLGLIVLVVIAYLIYSGSSSSNKSGNSKQPRYNKELSKKAQSFLPSIPKDYQIFTSNILVAGITFRNSDALRFINGSEQTLELERELNNPHDKNAIKVIGITPSSRYFVGYVPQEVSEQIIETGLLDKIKLRLARTYQGDNGYIEIQFQIIGLKELKKQYDAFLENQPADVSQKEFYKFFDLPIPKGLTTAQAAKTIVELRKKLKAEDASKLEQYDAYTSILEEFDDNDFREGYEVKKPGKAVLNDALNQLTQEGKDYAYLSDNIQEVVDRVIKLKPELERV